MTQEKPSSEEQQDSKLAKQTKDKTTNKDESVVAATTTDETNSNIDNASESKNADTSSNEKETKAQPDEVSADDVSSDNVNNDAPLTDQEQQQALKELAEQLQQDNQTSQTTQAPKADKTSSKPKKETVTRVKPARSWLAIFAFLFSLVTLAGVGFIAWRGQLWLDNQQQLAQIEQQTLLAAQQNITQLQSQFTQLQNAKSSQLTTNNRLEQQLKSAFARIKQLSASQPNTWLAAEASYLIHLAERRLLVEQDVSTAIQLLIDANQRLTEMHDPSVFSIRTAISEDVADLYAVKQPETDAVYLALSGLMNELPKLQFAAVSIPEPVVEQQIPSISNDTDDWQQNLQISLQRFFGNFVEIKRRNKAVEPQLPIDQRWFVIANLQTQLLMAQQATLQHNQAIYQDALAKVNLWTQQYFDADDLRVNAFNTAVISLTEKDIGLQLPESLTAQPLIANFVQQQLTLKGGKND